MSFDTGISEKKNRWNCPSGTTFKEDQTMRHTWLFVTACAMALSSTAQAQDAKALEQLEVISRSYAKDNHVAEAEASRRLELRQVLARPEIEAFKADYADRLDTAYWDDSRDGFKLVLRLKQGPLPAIHELSTTHGTIPVKFTLVSGKTLDEISAVLAANQALLQEQVPGLQGTGIDEVDAAIVLYVFVPAEEQAAYEAENAALSRQLGVPVRFKFLPGPMESEPQESPEQSSSSTLPTQSAPMATTESPYVRGGSQILNLDNGHQCTGGFIVRNKDNTKWGLVTAAHCGKNLMYGNWSDAASGAQVTAKLTYEDQLFDATHDLAWHSFPVLGYRPLGEVFARDTCSSCGVVILSTAAAVPGDRVCHRGLLTGWTCGVVSSSTASFGSKDCNGQVCDPRAYKVVVGDDLACFSGDSGGPVHYGNIAYGLVKSASFAGVEPGRCGALVFSPIGKIVDLGLRLY
ncbi:S1 family peptidase [Xanthomonas euvesicatoria]